MRRITHYLLELDSTEKNYIEDLVDGLCSDQAQLSRLLIDNEEKICTPCCTAIVELVAIPGLQRFWLGQVGMCFLTCSHGVFLLVGTIWGLVRYKTLAFNYN